jgi:AsmA protein
MNARSASPRAALRVLGIALAAVAVLVAAAWISLAVLLPHDRVLALVRGQLAASLRRETRLADVSVRLWPPVRLAARGFELAEPGGFARGAAARVGSLDLDLDVLPLLSRRLVVRSLTLERPVLHLVLREDGSTNFDSLFAATPAAGTTAGAPMDLAVRSFVVRGGELLADDLGAKRRVFLGLDTRLSLSAGGGSRFVTKGRTRLSRVALGPLASRGPAELNQSLARLVWVVEHDGRFDAAKRTLELDRLALGFGRARVTLAGTVADPGPRATLDLRAKGEGLDLGDLLGYLAAADARAVNGIRGGGRVAFDLRVAGRAGPGRLPSVTGWLSVKDGVFRYPGAPAGVDGIVFNARFVPDQVRVDDLRARVAGQPLRAQLALSRFADPEARFALEGVLDLAALSQLFAPKGTKLAGRADLSVHGNGRLKDPGGIALDGRVAIANASLESPALPQRVEAVSASIQLSPERATVRGFTARAGKSSFELDAAVTRPLALLGKPGKVEPAGLTFTFKSPYLDLAELLPPGPGGPLALNARGGGRVEIARFRNQKLDVENVVANVSVEPGVIGVPSFALRAYGGAVAGSARFGFQDPASPTFAVRGRADTVQVDRFLSAWSPAKGVVTGVATTDFDFSGDGVRPEQLKGSLTALGLALLAEGKLGGPVMEAIATATRTPGLREVSFRDLRLPFRVERGRVVTDSVRFGGGSGQWQASGAIGFDGTLDYAVSATLPPGVAGRGGVQGALAAGLLGDEQGRLLLDLHVTGNAKSPRVALDSKVMRDRLAGKATNLLRDQRARLGDALLRSSGLAPRDSGVADSAGRNTTKPDTKALGKELQKQGEDLFKGFFGGRKKPAPAAAPADTTGK